MEVKIGDTVEYREFEGSEWEASTIMDESERRTLEGLDTTSTIRVVDSSYARDRSSFGPTTDSEGRMFPGNVRCGGNVSCVSKAPNVD